VIKVNEDKVRMPGILLQLQHQSPQLILHSVMHLPTSKHQSPAWWHIVAT
jgi:hypothetical protein